MFFISNVTLQKCAHLSSLRTSFPFLPTCVSIGKESMFKNVQDPFLQFSVLLDLSIVLVVVVKDCVHKPLRSVDKVI